jgi:hypothetical protein
VRSGARYWATGLEQLAALELQNTSAHAPSVLRSVQLKTQRRQQALIHSHSWYAYRVSPRQRVRVAEQQQSVANLALHKPRVN